MNFEKAEKLAKQAKENQGKFETVTFQQGKGNVASRDLPFISDCYRLGSDETRQVIDNLNNCLSIAAAKRLSRLCYNMSIDDFKALLKTEASHLYNAYERGHITTAALYQFIDFRAGKKVTLNVRVK